MDSEQWFYFFEVFVSVFCCLDDLDFVVTSSCASFAWFAVFCFLPFFLRSDFVAMEPPAGFRVRGLHVEALHFSSFQYCPFMEPTSCKFMNYLIIYRSSRVLLAP